MTHHVPFVTSFSTQKKVFSFYMNLLLRFFSSSPSSCDVCASSQNVISLRYVFALFLHNAEDLEFFSRCFVCAEIESDAQARILFPNAKRGPLFVVSINGYLRGEAFKCPGWSFLLLATLLIR